MRTKSPSPLDLARLPHRQAHHFLTLTAICSLVLFLAACGSSTPPVTVSGDTFNYGDVAVGTQVRRIVVTIKNSSTSDVKLAPTLTGGTDFAFGSTVSCGATLPAASSCSMVATFAPSSEGSQTAVLDLGMSTNDQRIPLTGNGVQLQPGESIVTPTDNPLVARYTYSPNVSGLESVQFGPDTNYGRLTSAQAVQAGSAVSILVAGMQANSTYHMQAVVTDSNGNVVDNDVDQTFTTSNFALDQLPAVSVTANGTPQPGIEMMNPASAPNNNTYLQAYAIDLQGNLIWGYSYPDRVPDTIIQPIKQMPNGDYLMVISLNSNQVTGPATPGELNVLREVDLAGVPVRQISLDQMNSALMTGGYDFTIDDLHHDVVITPNGHWLVLGSVNKTYSGLPGTTGSANVVGDVVVDFDTNSNPVWAWNELDHLDVSRAPVGYPDWTHSNALLYVPGDGNILVSSRHQSWIMKVDYRNGAGTGNVLWRLGYQGDFKLVGGTEPQDWFYGQHQPSFIGPNTTGVFTLTMMDNGFTRQVGGSICSGKPSDACYTTVPVLSVDENAKTATITWRDTQPNSNFSVWGGGTTALANGNIEFDLCAEPNTTSQVNEVTLTSTPQTIWSASTTGQNLYRANRLPSLYPGVQW